MRPPGSRWNTSAAVRWSQMSRNAWSHQEGPSQDGWLDRRLRLPDGLRQLGLPSRRRGRQPACSLGATRGLAQVWSGDFTGGRSWLEQPEALSPGARAADPRVERERLDELRVEAKRLALVQQERLAAPVAAVPLWNVS